MGEEKFSHPEHSLPLLKLGLKSSEDTAAWADLCPHTFLRELTFATLRIQMNPVFQSMQRVPIK